MKTFTIEIDVPQELLDTLPEFGRSQTQRKLLEVYHALVKKSKYKRGDLGFFSVPSNYLLAINSTYNKKIQFLIDRGFIERRESYSYVGSNRFTKHYRLLKHQNLTKVNIEVPDQNDRKRWFINTQKSLKLLGCNSTNIKRDGYSGRLHHPYVKTYKRTLLEYYAIDASACHIVLLNRLMNQESIIDPELNHALKNGLFYESLISDYKTWRTRDEVKDSVQPIINGKRPTNGLFKKYPVFANWLAHLKYSNKELSRTLQFEESKVFIDGILCDLGDRLDFILTIHDSIIVREQEIQKAMDFLNENYSDFKWKVEQVRYIT